MSFHTKRNTTTTDATFQVNGENGTGVSSTAAGSVGLMATNVEGIAVTPTSVAIKPAGTAVVTYTATGAQATQTAVNLTKSSATTFLTVTLPTTLDYFSGIVDYCISATDATDRQTISGSCFVSGERKAATSVGGIGITGTQINAVSAGTHTNTFTAVDAGSGVLNFKANSVPSITPSAGAGHKIEYSFRLIAGSPTVALS